MEQLPEDIAAIVAEWAPLATVVRAKLAAVADSPIILAATRNVWPPDEERAACFNMPLLVPEEGAELRRVTFEDIAVRWRLFRLTIPSAVWCILKEEHSPKDLEGCLTGADLAVTGMPLELFQALWAFSKEVYHCMALQTSYKASQSSLQTEDSDLYRMAYWRRTVTDLKATRLRLHAYIALRLSLYARSQEAWHRRRHLVALHCPVLSAGS